MKKTNMNHFRQGDVGISRIDGHGFTLVPVAPENHRLILAHGEATGHHHSISVKELDGLALYTAKEQPQTMILVADRVFTVEHQEHGAITLDPGTYQVERQVEYDPEVQERRVAD